MSGVSSWHKRYFGQDVSPDCTTKEIVTSAITAGVFGYVGGVTFGNVGTGLIVGSAAGAASSLASPGGQYSGLNFALSTLAGGIVGALTSSPSGNLADDALRLTLQESLAQAAFQVGFYSAVGDNKTVGGRK